MALCLLSSIPLVWWLISVLTELLFYKCSKIQRKLSLRDCIGILDNYLDEDMVADLTKYGYGGGNAQNLFWYVENDDDDASTTGSPMNVEENIGTANDVAIDVGSGKTQGRSYNYSNNAGYSFKSREKVKRMMHLHKTYCYSQLEEEHSAKRYLRGNFILALVATMKLLVTTLFITLSLFALDTDPLTVLAFTGVAWTALWFQGGVVDLFRNYLYHFVILSTDKFHPGNIIQLEGHMKEPGCVFYITPLYTVLLIKRTDAVGRIEELLFVDVLNYNFFAFPMSTSLRWKKPSKRGTKAVAATTGAVTAAK